MKQGLCFHTCLHRYLKKASLPKHSRTRHSPSMCAKRALASSAAFCASLGLVNTLGTESMAAMDKISLEHLQGSQEAQGSVHSHPVTTYTSCNHTQQQAIQGLPGTQQGQGGHQASKVTPRQRHVVLPLYGHKQSQSPQPHSVTCPKKDVHIRCQEGAQILWVVDCHH
jgi:hypothetical protein